MHHKNRIATLLMGVSAIALASCGENESGGETETRQAEAQDEDAGPTAQTPVATAPQSEPTAVNAEAAPSVLLAEWDTPFGAPPFDAFEPDDYPSAMDAAMAAHLEEIDAIARNPEPATFDNTIAALDASGAELTQVARVFYNLVSADINDGLQEVQGAYAPKLSQHTDSITLNPELWARVRAVYDQRETLDFDDDQAKLLEDTHRSFVRAGADLDEDGKTRLVEINSRLSQLYTEFSNRARAEQTRPSVIVTDAARLDGLPEDQIKAARAFAERVAADESVDEETRAAAENGYAFNMIRSSFTPVLQFGKDRTLRKEILDTYYAMGSGGGDLDTRELIKEIAVLRAEKANLMGFDTFAAYAIDPRMAKTPEAAAALMTRVLDAALVRAKEERAALEAMLQEDLGADATLAAHDWWYYAEKVREAKYDLSEETLKPYFQVDVVRDGAFYVANRLFGINFTEVTDSVPLYHPDVKAFDVTDVQTGDHVGLLYLDYTARPTKRGGAWASAYRVQSNLPGEDEVRPIIVNVGSFFSPTSPDDPGLMSWDSVTTLFHELGHAIHGLVSRVRYEGQSGTAVKRDYVEFPSQVLENWAAEPAVLERYAKHFETGETIPAELMDKLKEAAIFNNGFDMTEVAAASLLDLAWHTKTRAELEAIDDVRAFDAQVMADLGVIPEIAPRYRSPYFSHVFSGDGYSAGYYVYLWAQVLSADAWGAFKATGDVFDPELSAKLTNEVFAVGGSRDEMESFVAFRGQEPDPDAFLREAGLIR